MFNNEPFSFQMMSSLDIKEDGRNAEPERWINYTISVLWKKCCDKKVMSESVKMKIDVIT